MSELEHARARFKAISEGRYAPKTLSVSDAKQRMRAADPGIDISGVLKALRRNDFDQAAVSVTLETLTDPAVVSYWSPVLTGLLQALVAAGKPAPSPKENPQT